MVDFSERTTGADGLAVIEAFGPADAGQVVVSADGYGIQPRWADPKTPGRKLVRLIAAAPLVGRLVPEKGDEELARGWRVRAWTNTITTAEGRS